MASSPQKLARLRKQQKREARRERAKTDLRFLAVDILGYSWTRGEFHRDVFKFLDEHRDHKRVALFAPRKSYKSRIEVCEILQQILINPDIKILLVHHKLELALELVTEASEKLQKCKAYRELLPSQYRPSIVSKTFLKKTNGGDFTLPGVESQAKPTLKGASADQDLTGAHPDMVYLDDIISAKTVDHHGGV